MMDTNEALADLQMRLTYQEDDLRTLNGIVTRQQTEIAALRGEIDRLRVRVATVAESGTPAQTPEPPPPHY